MAAGVHHHARLLGEDVGEGAPRHGEVEDQSRVVDGVHLLDQRDHGRVVGCVLGLQEALDVRLDDVCGQRRPVTERHSIAQLEGPLGVVAVRLEGLRGARLVRRRVVVVPHERAEDGGLLHAALVGLRRRGVQTGSVHVGAEAGIAADLVLGAGVGIGQAGALEGGGALAVAGRVGIVRRGASGSEQDEHRDGGSERESAVHVGLLEEVVMDVIGHTVITSKCLSQVFQ